MHLEIEKYPDRFYKLVEEVISASLCVNESKAIVKQAFDCLSERFKYIIALRWGLVDGIIWSYAKIGQQLSLSPNRVRDLENKARQELRMRARCLHLQQAPLSGEAHTPIESLWLSTRARNVIKKLDLSTIAELYDRKVDLYFTRGSGPVTMAEINRQLVELGLDPLSEPTEEDIDIWRQKPLLHFLAH